MDAIDREFNEMCNGMSAADSTRFSREPRVGNHASARYDDDSSPASRPASSYQMTKEQCRAQLAAMQAQFDSESAKKRWLRDRLNTWPGAGSEG